MKVGFVISQPFGKSIGTDVRVNGLLKGLSALDVEIHLLTPFGDNFSFNDKNVFVHRISSPSAVLHITNAIYWLSKRIVNNPFLFRKIMCNKSMLTKNARSFSKGILKIASELHLDILQAEQPIASAACVGLRDQLDAPIVVDFHGIWAEEMVASSIITYSDACYKTLFELEKEVAELSDAVTVVSPEMRDYVVESFCTSPNKVALISNATFQRVEQARVVCNPSKVIHSGTLHPWENVELFIKSMPYVLKNFAAAKFYLTRKGAKLQKVMKLAHDLAVSPEFFWFNSGTAFFEFLKSCDVGVISSTNHIARKMAYPAKLYDYLSIGLPIVANDIGAWTKIIKENRVGIVVDNSPEAFADGILEFLHNPDSIYQYGQRGLELVKNELNYYKSAEKLFNLYRDLIS